MKDESQGEMKESEISEDKSKEKKESVHEHHKKPSSKNLTDTIRENPWVLATLVLASILLIFIVANFTGINGKVISQEKVEGVFLSSLQTQGADVSSIEITEVLFENGMYKLSFNYQGAEYPIPFYISGDGKLIGTMSSTAAEMSEGTSGVEEAKEVQKSDRPEVQLFVWGYCPYGVQAQGPFTEVASLLKEFANFKIEMYYDGHGSYETQQNKIQECIQKIYPEKYWEYSLGFVEKIYPACSSVKTEECDKTESTKVMKSAGIDSIQVMSCVEEQGEELISTASSLAGSLGVTGSPTLVVNGIKVSVSRDAESFKQAVCEAFNQAPTECGEVLNSETAVSSGNC